MNICKNKCIKEPLVKTHERSFILHTVSYNITNFHISVPFPHRTTDRINKYTIKCIHARNLILKKPLYMKGI